MKTNASWVRTSACLAAFTVAAVSWADPADSTRPYETYTGTAMAVNPQDHALDVKGTVFSKKFNLGDTCAYVLPGEKAGTVNDLRPGEKLMVTYQDNQGVLVATRIEQVPMRYEGTVEAVDPASHTVKVRDHALGKTFQIAGDCQVALRHGKPGALADVQVGDYVTVTYETPDDTATAREISQTSQTFAGSLVAIDLPERTVKAQEGFTTKKFNLADDCAIVINDRTDGRLDDLRPNERIVLNYDEINGVNVANRISLAEAATNSVATTYPSSMPY